MHLIHPRSGASPALGLLARVSLLCVSLSLAAITGFAQASGGPYGPQRQSFPLPQVKGRILYVAPDGKVENTGEALDKTTSLEKALSLAVTGDAIVLRGGTYRTGNLLFNQGITLQAYADEVPVLKGSEVADKWEPLQKGIWRTSWKKLFPQKPADWWRRERSGLRTPMHRFNDDMVFVDGEMLQSAAWPGELNDSNFYVDYEQGYIYIGQDPTKHLVEITAHDGALTRVTKECYGRKSDKLGPVIRGLTFTQYAYRALEVEGTEPEAPADPSTFGKDVVGTLLEHVTITHCSRVAAYLRGDRTVIRHCLVSDTSTEGIYLLSSSDCLLERNIFRRNNVEEIDGYFPSAVKIFNQTHRVVCRENLVLDQPKSNGIWYDVGNVDGVFVNNWVENAESGFFFEISKGAICVGNVFVNCKKGIYVLNSSNVRCYHNTLVDSMASFERTERSAVGDHFGWHPASGPAVEKREGHVFVGNLLCATTAYKKQLLNFEQTKALNGKLTGSQAARVDANIYVREETGRPLVAWAPYANAEFKTEISVPADFQKLQPGFDANSKLLTVGPGSVLKSPELRQLTPLRSLKLAAQLEQVPEEAAALLPLVSGDRDAGAYASSPLAK